MNMAKCQNPRPVSAISFGTDGWRDVIADKFTFENVRSAAKAVADYMLSSEKKPQVVIGYDTRFMSKDFAAVAAEVLAAEGVAVLMTKSFAPTPVVSFSVCHYRTAGGIVITASHNPPKYNGFKFKAPYGGSASQEIMSEIESVYATNLEKNIQPRRVNLSDALSDGTVKLIDPMEPYFEALKTLLDTEVFKKNRFRIMVDPLYGAGQKSLTLVLRSLGCVVDEIHGTVFPSFGGYNPEPIDVNLVELKNEVLLGGYDAGLALDGDADRIGAIDEKGNFVDSHKIFSLILKHLAERKKWRGKVVKTVSTTQMVDRLAKKYGLPLIETPIGFKYICDHILSDDVLIGGEESGGISIKGHIPERDGILMGCLIVEVMAANGKRLGELVDELNFEAGPLFYMRKDLEIEPGEKERMIEWLKSEKLAQLDGNQIVKKNKKDGFKFFFQNDNWLLIRPSGTEPVVRIYAEADEVGKVESLIIAGVNILKRIESD